MVALPASAPAPQAGVAVAVDELSTPSPTGAWVVPPPGTARQPRRQRRRARVPGAGQHLGRPASATRARPWRRRASRASPPARWPPGPPVVVSAAPLAAAGFDPIMVRAAGPMAVSEDAGPSAGIGVVTMPGIPLAAAIGAVIAATGCAAGSAATARGRPQRRRRGSSKAKSSGPGEADHALDTGDEAADAVVPGPYQAGLGHRCRRAAAACPRSPSRSASSTPSRSSAPGAGPAAARSGTEWC